MLVFIGLSLGLCFLEEFADASWFATTFFLYLGLVIALIAIIGTFFEKLSDDVAYDLFSCGTLVLWFAYWKPIFEPDSPMFFFYPLYFAVMSAFVTLFLSDQAHRLDRQTKDYMRYWDKERVMPAWSLMLCVLGSLKALQHYQLFPVLMTLLMFRFAFSSCLK